MTLSLEDFLIGWLVLQSLAMSLFYLYVEKRITAIQAILQVQGDVNRSAIDCWESAMRRQDLLEAFLLQKKETPHGWTPRSPD